LLIKSLDLHSSIATLDLYEKFNLYQINSFQQEKQLSKTNLCELIFTSTRYVFFMIFFSKP